MNAQTAYGILTLITLLLGADYFNKYPINVKAVKRILRTIIDTLAKETFGDLCAYVTVITISGSVIWVIVENWV